MCAGSPSSRNLMRDQRLCKYACHQCFTTSILTGGFKFSHHTLAYKLVGPPLKIRSLMSTEEMYLSGVKLQIRPFVISEYNAYVISGIKNISRR